MNLKRQFLAMALIMWVAYYLYYYKNKNNFFKLPIKNNYILAVLFYIGAVMIHSSALLGVFLFLFKLVKTRISFLFIIIFILLYFVSFNFNLSNYNKIVENLVSLTSDSEYYLRYIVQQEEYESEGKIVTLFYRSFDIILFILLLFLNKKFSSKEYPLILCSITGLILNNILFGNFYRLNFYLTMFNLFTVPLLLSKIKHRVLFYIFLLFVIAIPAKLYYNAMFSNDKVTFMTAKFRNFYTIFDTQVDKRNMHDFIQ